MLKAKPAPRRRKTFGVLACQFILMAVVLGVSACRQDMHDNPKFKPHREGANRQIPEGTVARGSLEMNPAAPKVTQAAAPATSPSSAGAQASATPAPIPQGEDGFPFKLSDNPEERKAQLKAILDRGENRFNISCAHCHGRLGDGNGMIALRGLQRPAPQSYHIERLQKAPSSHFYDVITNGFGGMSSYADQLTPEDRWKVIAYVRVLQLSQRADVAKLGEEDKRKVETKIEEAEHKKEEQKKGQHGSGEGEKKAPASGGHSN